MKNILKLNKKGADPESVIFTIVALIATGIILLLFSHLFSNIHDTIDERFQENDRFNETEAHLALEDIQITENVVWDYAFLAIFIGYFIALGLSGFATRISPFFFWIYMLLALIGLFVGTMLSNLWIEIAESPALSATTARFPITNTLLGEAYPIVVTTIIVFSAIMLFGKPFSRGNER